MDKEFKSAKPIELSITTMDDDTRYITVQEFKITTNDDNTNTVSITT